ncbi:MAG: hypothetical protein ACXWJK_15880 [Burkholderiaceae bacterium]
MHPKALENMKAKVISALQGCTVKERWPVFDSYWANVSHLSEEVLKHKKEWLTSSNVYSIFHTEVASALKAKHHEDRSIEGALTDVLDNDSISALAERIIAIISSVPRKYIFYFPMPNVQLGDIRTLSLGHGIALRVFGKGEDVPGGVRVGGILGMVGMHLDMEKVYLCIEESGFTSGDTDDVAFSGALSKFKILTHLLLESGVFAERTISPIMYGLSGVGGHYVPNLIATVFDMERPNEIHATALLPIGIGRRTDKLCLNEESKAIQKAKSDGKEAFEKCFLSMLNHPVLLLSHEGVDSVPIRSAIEWAYEAASTENDTIAFIQVCIGIEAILGDETTSESITSKLADRCAYLLGNDISGRRTIRGRFLDLYRCRSKLAHGRAIRLKNDERVHLNWGKDVLNYLIKKEMKHLNLGKT